MLLKWAQKYKIKDILENKEKLADLKSLDLSYKNLQELPPELFTLNSLEFLDLSHNQLASLPKEILKLKSLKSLDISWNHIVDDFSFLAEQFSIKNAWNR